MNFHFSRNIHFSRHLKTEDRVREFNFRKLPSGDTELFHVDVPDDRGNRIVFKMQRSQGNQWKIVDQSLPKWIWDNEKGLNDLIEEELQHV